MAGRINKTSISLWAGVVGRTLGKGHLEASTTSGTGVCTVSETPGQGDQLAADHMGLQFRRALVNSSQLHLSPQATETCAQLFPEAGLITGRVETGQFQEWIRGPTQCGPPTC
jgi:hypothetical protein